MKGPIMAIDFDGTLCENRYPEIGEPNADLINCLLKLQNDISARLILWTCRSGELLDAAIAWCAEQGLIFNAVNQNLPDVIEEFGSDTRKIFANIYLDDRNYCFNKEYGVFVEKGEDNAENQ